MWKSSIDINEILRRQKDLGALDALYSLCVIWRNAVYTKDYIADDLWLTAPVLSLAGQELEKALIESGDFSPSADFYLALFCTFSHHELFFDTDKTDISAIENLLEREMSKEKIRYPFRFGRDLYDRFNDINQTNRTDHLLPEQAFHLLEGTPKGIYQVGSKLIGPLGVFDSMEPRAIYPSQSLPLWHCSDTGCDAVHFVKLEPYQNKVEDIFVKINKFNRDSYGPKSEWEKCLRWAYRLDNWENGKPYYDICELIAGTIIGVELTLLVERVLSGKYKMNCRQLLEKPPRSKSFAQGSAAELAKKLNREQQLHLLFVLPDEYLVEVLDDLIYENIIKVPIGEKRSPEFTSRGRNKDRHATLSSRGVRSEVNDPINQLISLITNGYEMSGVRTDLDWRVKENSTKNIRESLFNFILNNGPARAVDELILSSNSVTTYVCKEVSLSMRHVEAGSKKANDRILWKLGFNPDEFDQSISRIKEKNREFNEVVLSLNPVETEEHRQKIRSSGVNLFVYLEDYLDKYISYNVWLLSTDHFAGSNFVFDLVKARSVVPAVLGANIASENGYISWSRDGSNTLGVLLTYLAKAIDWIASLTDSTRSDLKRDESELPHYSGDISTPFLFRHSQLWADADRVELERYSERFSSISRLILQANLAEIRNGIDHHRDEFTFPDNDKMLACSSRLQLAFESADVNRFFPKYFWLAARGSTRFGVIQYTYSDYAGREFVMHGPPSASGLPSKVYRDPVIIAPFNLLGHPNAHIIFRVKERSLYSDYWDGYPRRRSIKPSAGDLTEAGLSISDQVNNSMHPIPNAAAD